MAFPPKPSFSPTSLKNNTRPSSILTSATARLPNKPEADLVRQLACTHWRLVRYTAIETCLLEIEMQKSREYVDKVWNKVDDRSRVSLWPLTLCLASFWSSYRPPSRPPKRNYKTNPSRPVRPCPPHPLPPSASVC